jgi:hypothetical protein
MATRWADSFAAAIDGRTAGQGLCCINLGSLMNDGQSRSRPVVSCSSAVAFLSILSCCACAGTVGTASAAAMMSERGVEVDPSTIFHRGARESVCCLSRCAGKEVSVGVNGLGNRGRASRPAACLRCAPRNVMLFLLATLMGFTAEGESRSEVKSGPCIAAATTIGTGRLPTVLQAHRRQSRTSMSTRCTNS